MPSEESVNGAIAFGPGRRKLVTLPEIVRNGAAEIEAGRFASLRREEITTVALDPTAHLQVEGVRYRFTAKRDGGFEAKRRD